MISRYFVILLAFGVAALRIAQGAWVEAAGLLGLGAGLVFLKLAERRPALRRWAWPAFGVTAISVAVALLRLRAGS